MPKKNTEPGHTSVPPAPEQEISAGMHRWLEPAPEQPTCQNCGAASGTCLGVCNTCRRPFSGAPAVQETAHLVNSDEHITLIVGPTIRDIYGESAELGHYKLAIAVYKLATSGVADLTVSLSAEVARLKESIEILGGRGDLEKMRADIAEEKVARLEKERDDAIQKLAGLPAEYVKRVTCSMTVREVYDWLKDAAEARIRELEDSKK